MHSTTTHDPTLARSQYTYIMVRETLCSHFEISMPKDTMDKVKVFFMIVFLCAECSLPVTSLKEFSLARFSDILVYANNSAIDIELIGEGFEGDQITDGGALECHTDDTNCCRSTDGTAGGEWYGPDGNRIISPRELDDYNGQYYRTRGHMVIRLNRGYRYYFSGLYRCEIPGAGGGNITRYITLTRGDGLCADLPSLTNGTITYTPPRVLSSVLPYDQRYQGTIATYSCSQGFQLFGRSTQRACLGGTWNGTQPSCVMSNCSISELTYPADVQKSIEGTTVTYTCAIGYTLHGSMTRTCNPITRTWTSITDPTCQIKNCGPLTSPDNGHVDTSSGTTFESTATYTCDTGYTLIGSSSRTCGADGSWTSTEPVCQIVDCGPLTALANGQVDTSSGTTFGSTATYTCDTGYIMSGTATTSCNSTGNWSPPAPICQTVDCGPLSNPVNGQVDLSNGTIFRRTASYICCVPAGSRTCESDGQWTSSEPTCSDPGSTTSSNINDIVVIIAAVLGVLMLISLVINALMAVYIIYLKRQNKDQCTLDTTADQYETVGGGSAPEYEEVDKAMKEKMGQPHPPKGDYELTQCTAYGPVSADNA